MTEETDKKIIEVNCDTCSSTGCREDDSEFWMEDYDEPNEESFCKNRGLLEWHPKKEYQATFCEDCPMWGTTVGYMKNDPEHTKCCRHAEPCWKNPNHNDISKWGEFLVEYKNRFIRRTKELIKQIEHLRNYADVNDMSTADFKCLICERHLKKIVYDLGYETPDYICHLCEQRIYWWIEYPVEELPRGWVEDIEKNPIVFENLKRFNIIKSEVK